MTASPAATALEGTRGQMLDPITYWPDFQLTRGATARNGDDHRRRGDPTVTLREVLGINRLPQPHKISQGPQSLTVKHQHLSVVLSRRVSGQG